MRSLNQKLMNILLTSNDPDPTYLPSLISRLFQPRTSCFSDPELFVAPQAQTVPFTPLYLPTGVPTACNALSHL